MIVYDLVCEREHGFEGWFSNIDDFESQQAVGQIACPVCGATLIRRLPSALPVCRSTGDAGHETEAPQPSRSLSAEVVVAENKVRALHRYVKDNFDDVGDDFSAQARKIHDGDAEKRNIWGQATHEQVRSLYEDGIPALPLPPDPAHKNKLN